MRNLLKNLYFLLPWVCAAANFNIDTLVAKANIYYQRAPSLGPPSELILSDVNELPVKTDIKVIIHGFTGSRKHNSIAPLGNAYMAGGTANVLLADWEDAAGLDYTSARKAVGKVGKFLGKILNDFINKFSIERTAIHVLGHSLGAHIAGDIGKYFNGTLGRATGLDPALPLFTKHAVDSLQSRDAQFVDVVHTDYPVFGDLTPRGTVDFYPNFGQTPQRGCDDIDLIAANSCSHNRAVILYAETIGSAKNFPTLPCSLAAIKMRNYNACLKNVNNATLLTAIANMDESQVVYMGEHVSRSATGFYYMQTYDTPPYGMGVNTKF